MTGINVELERLLMGANISLERGDADVPKWLAEQLQAIYASYESTKDVRATHHGQSVLVERANGMPRTLTIGTERRWELAASATGTPQQPHAVNMPGQIATILADP